MLIYYSKHVISVGVEEEDRKHTWMDDADSVSLFICLFIAYYLCKIYINYKYRIIV